MSGYVGDLNSQQEEALRKLKAAFVGIPQPEESDHYYLRWLRARKFNVRKAEDMLRNHLEVRKQYGLDTISHWTPPEVLQKCYPGGFFGEDREGHPVWYDSIGALDFKGLHRSVKREDVLRLNGQRAERMAQLCMEVSEKKGRHIENITFIIDFEQLSIQKHYYWPGIQMVREVLSFFEANYPERTRRAFAIKVPPIFPVAYSLVKYFMDERTRQRFTVLGGNWQEELQKYISPDNLPQAYGGTRCQPDPLCTDYINPGYDVPKEYYLTSQTETGWDEMERVVVGRGSTYSVKRLVEEPKSLLRWEFVSTDHDISFGIHQERDKTNKKDREVVPMKRRNSNIIPETGVHTCETIGSYVLKFDNSYSWTRSKEIFYSVKVLPPGDAECNEPTIASTREPLTPDDMEPTMASTREPLTPDDMEPTIASTREPLTPDDMEPTIASTREPLTPDDMEPTMASTRKSTCSSSSSEDFVDCLDGADTTTPRLTEAEMEDGATCGTVVVKDAGISGHCVTTV